jgi:hypothetical protein
MRLRIRRKLTGMEGMEGIKKKPLGDSSCLYPEIIDLLFSFIPCIPFIPVKFLL